MGAATAITWRAASGHAGLALLTSGLFLAAALGAAPFADQPVVILLALVAGVTLMLSALVRPSLFVVDPAGTGAMAPLESLLMRPAIIGLFGYQIAYNYLPDGLRTALASALGVLAMIAALPFRHRARPVRLAAISLVALVLVDVVAMSFDVHSPDVAAWLREFFPLILAVGLMRNPSKAPMTLVVRCAWVTALIGSVYSLAHGVIYIEDIRRLTPFTGGADVHASAYVLVVCLIVIVEGVLHRRMKVRTAAVALLPAAAALVLFASGTAFVMIFLWAVVRFWVQIRSLGKRMIVVLLILLAAGFFVEQRIALHDSALYKGSTTGIDAFSSGRISTWTERIAEAGTRTTGQLLVGGGVGSDLTLSTAWVGLGAKNSHSDVLTIALEDGLLGYFAFAACVTGLFSAAHPRVKGMALAYIGSAAIANGFPVRPMIDAIFWIAAAAVTYVNIQPNAPPQASAWWMGQEPQVTAKRRAFVPAAAPDPGRIRATPNTRRDPLW